jgi:hypothetical protein
MHRYAPVVNGGHNADGGVMAKAKTEAMIEDRVTIAVRYPLDGGVPGLDATVDALTSNQIEETESTYDASIAVVSKSRKTVRVPVAEPEPVTADG